MTDFRPTLGPGSSNSLPGGLSLWSGLLWLFPLGVKIYIYLYIYIYISTLFKDSFLHRLYKECTHLPLRSEITSLQILLLRPQANGFPMVPWARILHAEGIGLGSAGSSWVGDLWWTPVHTVPVRAWDPAAGALETGSPGWNSGSAHQASRPGRGRKMSSANVLEAPECAICWAGAHLSVHTQLCSRHLIPGVSGPILTQGAPRRKGG